MKSRLKVRSSKALPPCVPTQLRSCQTPVKPSGNLSGSACSAASGPSFEKRVWPGLKLARKRKARMSVRAMRASQIPLRREGVKTGAASFGGIRCGGFVFKRQASSFAQAATMNQIRAKANGELAIEMIDRWYLKWERS